MSISRTPDGTAIAGATAVTFTAIASDASSDTLTVSWDLGDGRTASGASAVHVYASAAVYPVAVTVRNGRGGVTTVGTSIAVGSLSGRWLLSEGGTRFYERGFDIAQTASDLVGRPFSVPAADRPHARVRANRAYPRFRRPPGRAGLRASGEPWRGPKSRSCISRTRVGASMAPSGRNHL